MLREYLQDAYDDFFKLVIFNLLWALATLLVVTAPAGSAGLYYAANQMAHHEEVDWRTFVQGFRQYWRLGWRWALVNLAATALLAFNFWFYGQYPADWAKWLQGLVLGVGILWLLVQIYTFPLLLEQADRRMRVAMRNSLVLYLKRPGVGLGLALLEAVILVLSYLLRVPWVLITASLCAYLASRVVVSLVNELQPAGSSARPVD